MADKKIKLRKLIFNDKYLIITALILAVLVWVVTSLNIGTDETRTIHIDTSIKLSDELQEQLGMKYYTLQNSVDLHVSISGAKYVIGQVTEDDLKIKFDSSNVTRAGEQSIPIQVSNKSSTKDFTVTSVYPNTVDAYFDVEETRDFEVSIVYDDSNVANGYMFGTPVISDDTVSIVGPKSYVDRIQRVDAEVDFGANKDITESYNTECKIQIKGSGVEANYMKVYSTNDAEQPIDSVDVTLPVLMIVNLPVSVDFENEPKSVIKNAVNTSYSVDKLRVGVLRGADVSNAVLGEINYNDLKIGKNIFTFDTSDIQGAAVIDGQNDKVTVTVDVSDADYEEITVPITTSSVDFKGVPKGSSARVRRLDKYSVRVIVPKGTTLNESDLKIVADISKIKDDECKLDISVKNKSSWVVSDYTATVNVSED